MDQLIFSQLLMFIVQNIELSLIILCLFIPIFDFVGSAFLNEASRFYPGDYLHSDFLNRHLIVIIYEIKEFTQLRIRLNIKRYRNHILKGNFMVLLLHANTWYLYEMVIQK